ncbi:MAG: DUF87 domain-containing protein, partial [Candidatus Gracilibacteria bacterium]
MDNNTSTTVNPKQEASSIAKVDSSDSKVFSSAPSIETPEWLKDASQKASSNGKISGAGVEVDPIINLRDKKPSLTEIGEDPSSEVTVSPDFEVVKKADLEAQPKMRSAGYDPFTGKKSNEIGASASVSDPAKLSLKDKIREFGKKIFDRLAFAKHKDASVVLKKEEVKGIITTKVNTAGEKNEYIEAERIYQEGLASVKDLIAPSSMEIYFDSVKIDGLYSRSFYVYAYPRYLDANWLSPIVNFDITMDISQFIYPISSETILKTLKKKVAQMQSTMRMSAEKGNVRDPAIETALEDAESLRTEIQRGQEKFFQFALYFTVYADDEKKLEKIAKQLESLLAGRLVMTKRAQIRPEHALNSCLPQCLDELYVIRNMNTSPLSTSFPFTSSDLTSDKGILYGLNRHNDSLIIFDRFALENANSVVFAKSGAGKSFAVKLEILRMMMMGTDVIVIDPENEYESLSNVVGGS